MNPQSETRYSGYKIVVVGASLGGLDALRALLGGLPADFQVSVAVVQHRTTHADEALVAILQSGCALTVREAEDKDPIGPGVFLAPADYHLLVEDGCFALSTDPPALNARPSIDVLFESAADACAEGVIGVVLTGTSQDGARGAARIKERGGLVVVQDPATAESPVMPQAAVDACRVDHVLPLPEIAPFLVNAVRQGG